MSFYPACGANWVQLLSRRSRAWNFSFNIALKYRYALCRTRQKTHMSDIVAIAFLITGNCDEVLMTKLRTWLQQWVYMAKRYNSFTLAWTPRYFPLILLAPSWHWPRICSRLSPSWDSCVRIVDARSLPVVEETGTKHKNYSCTLVSLINHTDKLSCSVWLTHVTGKFYLNTDSCT